MPKIITGADLSQFLEGCLGLAAAVAQDTVKLLLRVCVRALADGGAGETIGIGLGNLHAAPGRHNAPGVGRPAFQPSRTFLRYLEKLQARACAGESLGRAFPQMHRRDLVELLVGRGMRRAMADRIAKAAITFWFDRLVSGCAVELPGGVAQVTWRRTRIRRRIAGALRRGHLPGSTPVVPLPPSRTHPGGLVAKSSRSERRMGRHTGRRQALRRAPGLLRRRRRVRPGIRVQHAAPAPPLPGWSMPCARRRHRARLPRRLPLAALARPGGHPGGPPRAPRLARRAWALSPPSD